MEIIISAIIGILYTTGIYLLLRRSLVKLILGIIFLNNATFLLIYISGGLKAINPAFLSDHSDYAKYSDPLPQALVLTALVISLGVTALILTVKYRYYQKTGTDDLDEVTEENQ